MKSQLCHFAPGCLGQDSADTSLLPTVRTPWSRSQVVILSAEHTEKRFANSQLHAFTTVTAKSASPGTGSWLHSIAMCHVVSRTTVALL